MRALTFLRRRRWWTAWVSGPGAHDWPVRVRARDWYGAGIQACRLAAQEHGGRPAQYHLRAIEPSGPEENLATPRDRA